MCEAYAESVAMVGLAVDLLSLTTIAAAVAVDQMGVNLGVM